MTVVWVEGAGATGKFVPDEAPVVPAGDRGLAYGDGLFETVRVSRGEPVFLARHVKRMLAGLASLRFPPLPWNAPALAARCREVIAQNSVREGVLKLVITRGTGPRGWEPPAEARPRLIVQVTSRQPASAENAAGLRAMVAPWRVDPASPLCYVKNLSGLDKVLARDMARRAGANEALFLNLNDQLTEGAASNLFLVIDEQILTPRVSCGLLPGIAREVLLESAATLPLPIGEAELTLASLPQASEAFLTNAVMGVAPLIEVEGRPVGNGRPGPVAAAVAAQYERWVEVEVQQ